MNRRVDWIDPPSEEDPLDDVRLWTAKEVAQMLQMSTAWVHEQARKRSGLPFIQLGNRYRFDPKAVREWWKKKQQFPHSHRAVQ